MLCTRDAPKSILSQYWLNIDFIVSFKWRSFIFALTQCALPCIAEALPCHALPRAALSWSRVRKIFRVLKGALRTRVAFPSGGKAFKNSTLPVNQDALNPFYASWPSCFEPSPEESQRIVPASRVVRKINARVTRMIFIRQIFQVLESALRTQIAFPPECKAFTNSTLPFN